MPRHEVVEHAATAELILENRKGVPHGMELHAGSLLPIAAERTHTALRRRGDQSGPETEAQ